MTVTYTSEVSTSSGISKFLKLLARWRGSIYKLMWVDLLLFLSVYYTITFLYLMSSEDSKRYFEKVINYCDKYLGYIPLSFILGFYVNLITTRWWNQYTSIPFPDSLAILVGASVKGVDEKARMIRRTIVRYACAALTITFTMLSPKVKKRFPTLNHFIDAGLLTKDEKTIINELDEEFPSYSKYWLPMAWASNLVAAARKEGLIHDDDAVESLLEELNKFRGHLGSMLDYDWISVPLVYTQVVTLVVYVYFLLSAIGKQYIDHPEDGKINLYFPIFPVLEYFFYMGWLKVAEVLINPYGDDDDDFEVVWMIDRNLQVSYILVDKIHNKHPKLIKDLHWEETAPNSLPYTIASQKYTNEYYFPSTSNIKVNAADQDILMPNEETFTQIDGVKRRTTAFAWRMQGPQRNSKRPEFNIQLSKVSSNYDSEPEPEVVDNAPTAKKSTRTPEPCEEFETLKRQRQAEHRRRIENMLSGLSKHNIK